MNFNRKKPVLMFLLTLLFNPVLNAQLLESFDNINTLQADGWVFDNRSDFTTIVDWAQGDTGLFPAHSGVATSYIFNTTASAADLVCNWLIMPEVGAIEQLSFYTRSDNQANEVTRMKVMYSPTGDISTGDCLNAPPTKTNNLKGGLNFGSFQSLLTINQNQVAAAYPQEWTQYTVDVNGSGRIAFLYYVETGAPNFNSGTLAIDTVSRSVGAPAGSLQAIPSFNVWGLSLLLLAIAVMGLFKQRNTYFN